MIRTPPALDAWRHRGRLHGHTGGLGSGFSRATSAACNDAPPTSPAGPSGCDARRRARRRCAGQAARRWTFLMLARGTSTCRREADCSCTSSPGHRARPR